MDQVKQHRDWIKRGEVAYVEDGGMSRMKIDDWLLLDKTDLAVLT
jgi:hypothetical protein